MEKTKNDSHKIRNIINDVWRRENMSNFTKISFIHDI